MYISDPRTKKWLLASTPGPLLTILATYLYFCLYAGPKFMKNKKPFDLKNTLVIYNVVQVVLSVVLVIEVRKFIIKIYLSKIFRFDYHTNDAAIKSRFFN